jgi:hypothetical protein
LLGLKLPAAQILCQLENEFSRGTFSAENPADFAATTVAGSSIAGRSPDAHFKLLDAAVFKPTIAGQLAEQCTGGTPGYQELDR